MPVYSCATALCALLTSSFSFSHDSFVYLFSTSSPACIGRIKVVCFLWDQHPPLESKRGKYFTAPRRYPEGEEEAAHLVVCLFVCLTLLTSSSSSKCVLFVCLHARKRLTKRVKSSPFRHHFPTPLPLPSVLYPTSDILLCRFFCFLWIAIKDSLIPFFFAFCQPPGYNILLAERCKTPWPLPFSLALVYYLLYFFLCLFYLLPISF